MPRDQPRVSFIKQQIKYYEDNKPGVTADQFVENFRLHYQNKASFASSLSRFKSMLRKVGSNENFLSGLKLNIDEQQQVKTNQKKRLELKCRNAITLKNCGDNLISYARACLESNDLGQMVTGLMVCTGLRMVEIVARAKLSRPKMNHTTDSCYWSFVEGICKKHSAFPGHERPVLHRRELVVSCLERLRNQHFPDLQDTNHNNTYISRKVCNKINRSIRNSWPFPEVKRISSHFFRSFYVSATFHYFNQSSSLPMWACDVLAHESIDTTHSYTTLLITGYGSLSFDSERQLQGLARLTLSK